MDASEDSTVSRSRVDISSPQAGRKINTHEVWSLTAAAVIAAFYLVTSLYIASHRLFWFDEIVTVHIARLPHWVTIWAALAYGADSQPPFYYMVVRTFDKLFGHSEVAARLPSVLALVAGMLITFDCTRRLTDGLHGLIALSVLTCSYLLYYGHEARPYAIYFLLAALALWIWMRRAKATWGAISFGFVLFLGVTIHYYFVLCLVPYALWEIIRWRPWQPPSRKLLAGVLGVLLPAAVLSPLILRFSRQFSIGFLGGTPSFGALTKTFSEFFPNGLFLLALVVVWITLVGAEDKDVVLPPMQAGEAVGWLSLCIPLAGFAIAELKTNAFTPRYFIGALPGIALAFSCCLWRHFRHNYRVSLGVFLLLATWGVKQEVSSARHIEWYDAPRTGDYLRMEDSLRTDGKRFTLFSWDIAYLAADYYSKRPPQCILLIPSDPTQALKTAGLEFNLSAFYPLHFWTLDDLKKHAQETALILPKPELLDSLKKNGFRVEVRSSQPIEVVYLK